MHGPSVGPDFVSASSSLRRTGSSSSSSSSSASPVKLVFSPKRRSRHVFSALPHHKKLVEAGAKPGDRVVVKGVEYVVRSRQLKNARLLGVERADKGARAAAAAAAGPALSPLVPKVGKRDQPGDEVEFKGRRFRLQKKAKVRRWVKIAGPAFPKRARGAASAAAPAAAARPRSRSSPSTQTTLFGTAAPSSRSSSRRRRRLSSLKRKLAARRIQGAFRRRRAAKPAAARPSRSRSAASRSSRSRRLASLRRRAAARKIKGAYRALLARRAARTPPPLIFSHLPAPKELKARKARVGQQILVGDREYVVGEQRVGDKVVLRARKITGSEKRRRKAEQQRLEAEAAAAEIAMFPAAPGTGAGAAAAGSASLSGIMRRFRSLRQPARGRTPPAPPSDVVIAPGCLSFVLKASCRKQLCGAAKSKSKSKSKSRSRSRTPPGGAAAVASGL